MSVIDLIAPRICTSPESPESLGSRAVEFARRIGLTLDPEQEMALELSLGVRDDGRWSSFEVGLNVPRQNGKGEVLMARELFGLFELDEGFIVHSAHEFKTSERHFQRMEAVIRSCPELLRRVKRADTGTRRIVGFRYSHGDEAIELEDGSKIEFRTRTKGGMRGFDDVALLVLDESQILAEHIHGTMIPTLRASKASRGPQLWYAGNAADQLIHDHAVVWARVRERGLAGDDPALTYLEWSLEFEHPDEVPEDVVCDPDYWRTVNFAIARGRVLIEQMEFEFRSLARRSFIVELLGVGDYPATDASADLVISAEQWAEVEDTESVLEDPITLAVDVSQDGRTSIAAAGLNQRGVLHMEVIHVRGGTAWAPARLEELYQRHEVVEVICDAYGPAVGIASKLDDAGITVRRIHAGEYAEACAVFENAVREREVRHIGQDDLTSAVRGARTRPLVDRWAWSRTKSVADVGPLIAGTLAVWSAAEQDFGNVNIF